MLRCSRSRRATRTAKQLTTSMRSGSSVTALPNERVVGDNYLGRRIFCGIYYPQQATVLSLTTLTLVPDFADDKTGPWLSADHAPGCRIKQGVCQHGQALPRSVNAAQRP